MSCSNKTVNTQNDQELSLEQGRQNGMKEQDVIDTNAKNSSAWFTFSV